MARFLKRAWNQVWELSEANGPADDGALARELNRQMHATIKKVTADIERFNFNTALAAIMELSNACADYLNATSGDARDGELCHEVASAFVLLLAPYAPHWADELWTAALGNDGSTYDASWPTFDEAATVADEVERAVMIGGKVRGHILTAADASEEEIVAAALAAVADRIEGLTVRKTIVAPTVVNVVAN